MKIIWKGKITGEDEIKFQRDVEMSGGGPGGGGPGGGAAQPSPDIIAKRVK